MEKPEIYERLTRVFRDVFDDDTIVVRPELTDDDVDEWDSLSHIRLVLTVEKIFNIKLSASEIGNLTNVGELVEAIQAKALSNSLYTNLSWLPPPPRDFSAQCRAALESSENLGGRFRALASQALDENQLTSPAKVLAKAQAAGRSLEPLTPFSLGVSSNATLDFIVPALIGSAPRHDIALTCIPGEYDLVCKRRFHRTRK